MKQNYEIDEIFRKAFNDFPEEEPSKLTWAALSEKIVYKRWLGINFSKFSYRVATWSIATIIIVGVGLTTYFVVNQGKESKNITSLSQNSSNLNKNTQNSEIKPTKESNLQSSEPTQNSTVDNSKISNNKVGTGYSNQTSEKTSNNSANQVVYKNNNELAITSTKTKLDNFDVIKKELINSEDSYETKDAVVQTDIERPIPFKNEKSQINSGKVDSIAVVNEIKTNNSSDNNIKKKINSDSTVGVISAKQLPNQNSKKSAYRNFSVSLFAGSSYINKTFDATTGSEHYSAFRLHYEAPISTLALGAEISYRFNRLVLQSGLNYTQFGENINYEIMNVTDTKSINIPIIEPIYNPDTAVIGWDTIGWIDFKDTTLALTKYNRNNRFDYLEIPLLAGYQFGKKRFIFEVSTGLSFGFLINAKGVILNTKENDVYEINSKNDFPLNKNLTNFVFRFKFAYRVNENWNIYLQPNIKYNLNSVLSKDFPVNQKYNSSGINFGVSFDL